LPASEQLAVLEAFAGQKIMTYRRRVYLYIIAVIKNSKHLI